MSAFRLGSIRSIDSLGRPCLVSITFIFLRLQSAYVISMSEEEAKKRWEAIIADANANSVGMNPTESGSIVFMPVEDKMSSSIFAAREHAIEHTLTIGEGTERDDRSTMDKVIAINVGTRPRTLVLPTGMTEQNIKTFTENYIESSKPGWMFERIDDRDGKLFAKPIDFAVLGGNQLIMTGGDTAYSRNFDIGLAIYNEIENHGRTTADELKKHIEGVSPELLFIVVNMMLVKDYLCIYREADGTQTLELVDEKVRDARMAIANNMMLESLVDFDEDSRYFLSVLPPYTACF